MKKLTASLALLSLLVTGAALAAENDAPPPPKPGMDHRKGPEGPGGPGGPKGPQPRKHVRLKDCDKDKDGMVSLEEYMQCFPQAKKEFFDVIDADKDGKITREESQAWRAAKRMEREEARKQQRQELFKRCDKDGNGSLSLEEFMQCGPKDFHKRPPKPGSRPGKPGDMPGRPAPAEKQS